MVCQSQLVYKMLCGFGKKDDDSVINFFRCRFFWRMFLRQSLQVYESQITLCKSWRALKTIRAASNNKIDATRIIPTFINMYFQSGSRTVAISKMKRFVIIVNSFQPLTIIPKCSILDVAAVLDPPLIY